MDWANSTYSTGHRPPAKVMLELDNPYSPAFKNFIDENNYELSSGRLIGDKVGNALDIMMSVIGVIGVLIVLLALLVFVLNFRVLIAKATYDIRLLLQLGYKHQTIVNSLIRRFLMLLTISAVLAFGTLYFVRHLGLQWLYHQGFELSTDFHQMTIVAGIAVLLLILSVNLFAIRKSVIELGKN